MLIESKKCNEATILQQPKNSLQNTETKWHNDKLLSHNNNEKLGAK